MGEGALLIAVILFVSTMGGTPVPAALLKDSQLAPPFIQLGQQAFETSRHIFAEKNGVQPPPKQVQKQ